MRNERFTISGPALLADGVIREATLVVGDGRIESIRAGIDAGADLVCEGVVAPGFIDLQVNGGYGHDFTQDPSSIAAVAERLPESGVTGFLPTRITSPIDTYAGWLEAAAAVRTPPGAAHVLGVHLEGVYFNPLKKGAHNPAWLRPIDVAEITGRYACHPLVRIVTLAPELDGALEAIAALRAQGVIVSAGHSNANWEQARSAITAGIGWGTHLFNAMRELGHRDPGLAAALLLSDLPVGLIADGVHLHPAIVEMVWRLKGARGITLVTDAMTAMGMGDGRYVLGAYEVIVQGQSARLADGTLAGSILTMDGAVRYLVQEIGCPLADALTMASRTPADLLGLATKGRLLEGCDADIVLLKPSLHVQATVVGGVACE